MSPPLRLSRRSLLAVLLVGLAACDSGSADDATITDVLTAVQIGTVGADLSPDAFPTGGTGAAPILDGSAQIVRGGSVILELSAAGVDNLYVGVEGETGYYIGPVAASEAQSLILTTNGEDTAASYVLLFVTDVDGTLSAVTRRTVTVNSEANASGQIQVSLNWNAPVDLDLHLETPEGEDVYYGNETSQTGGQLDLDSNAACGLDRVDNENITWPDGTTASAGTYIVRVDYWSACGVTEPVPFVVTVNVRGTVRTFDGTFQPMEADAGGAFDGREIYSFTFPGGS